MHTCTEQNLYGFRSDGFGRSLKLTEYTQMCLKLERHRTQSSGFGPITPLDAIDEMNSDPKIFSVTVIIMRIGVNSKVSEVSINKRGCDARRGSR